MSTSPFAALGLSESLLSTLAELGYEQPSPIQSRSIPLLLTGKNLLGVAQTGTGKTAAFALPLLQNLVFDQKSPQVLILTPTRELAIQVAEACQSYSRRLKQFHVLPVYGGQDMGTQLRALKRGVQVVVGTPGRIMDHMRRGSLNLANIRAVVLDEADEMLRMGFIDDVETILAETPDGAQRALFSATMPPAIQRIANKYLGDAEEVRIESKTRTVERISQRYLLVHNPQKLDALTRILEVENFDGMIIFVRTKSSTVELSEKLEARGFAAGALNGDLSQQLRERTINRLKQGELDIVVATDVAARGLDVERISHVINYDIPYDNESYVHRIGRTGRAGREGNAILFVTPKERRLLNSIERSTRQPIDPMTLPSGEEVSEQRIQQFQHLLLSTLEEQDLSPFRQLVSALAGDQGLAIEDIAAALVYLQQQDRPLYPVFRDPVVRETGKQKDRGEKPGKRKDRERPSKGQPVDNLAMERYRVEVGYNQGVKVGDIVGAIANEADIDSQYIGRIDMRDDYSTVDLPEGMPKELLQSLQSMRIRQHLARLRPVPADDSDDAGDKSNRKSGPRKRGTPPLGNKGATGKRSAKKPQAGAKKRPR